MPIIKSAIKRARQATKRRERNVVIKKGIKGAVKAFLTKPSAKNLSAAQSELDNAVKKGLLKKNTAARRKANLSKVAKNAGVKLATTPKAKPVAKTAAKSAAGRTTAKTVAAKPAAKKVSKSTAGKTPAKAPAKSAAGRTTTAKKTTK